MYIVCKVIDIFGATVKSYINILSRKPTFSNVTVVMYCWIMISVTLWTVNCLATANSNACTCSTRLYDMFLRLACRSSHVISLYLFHIWSFQVCQIILRTWLSTWNEHIYILGIADAFEHERTCYTIQSFIAVSRSICLQQLWLRYYFMFP